MLDSATVLALSEADAALGHLHGLGHLTTDPTEPKPSADRCEVF